MTLPKLCRAIRTLCDDRSGVALVELAFACPLVLFLILGLVELGNYAITRQRLSQVALQVADNAGRLGDTSLGRATRLTEKQVTDALVGGVMQAGGSDFGADGRIILSSLERNKDGGQWVHWQRCTGQLSHPSSFGNQDAGKTGTSFPGMGPDNARITAETGRAVMFVEVAYRLRPLAIPQLVPSTPITETASMPIRQERDLAGLTATADTDRSEC